MCHVPYFALIIYKICELLNRINAHDMMKRHHMAYSEKSEIIESHFLFGLRINIKLILIEYRFEGRSEQLTIEVPHITPTLF